MYSSAATAVMCSKRSLPWQTTHKRSASLTPQRHAKIFLNFITLSLLFMYHFKTISMSKNKFIPAALAAASLFFLSCNNTSSPKTNTETTAVAQQLREEEVNYTGTDSTHMKGFVVYGDSVQGKRPAVLVVHEWWGLNDYAKERARQLARLGYIAMAVDMYGNGPVATDPKQAIQLAGPFYKNPQLTKTRLDAALAKLKTYPQADTSKIAAIGYCYGGFVVTNAAKLGAPLAGVVSFHGDLSGVTPDKNLTKAKFLICHGAADSLVPARVVAQFKKQMDSIGADYTLKAYPNALH